MAQGNTGGGGPSEHNPFRDRNFRANPNDEQPDLEDSVTAQDQALDEGPSKDNRPIGEHTAQGRPPLMEK